MTLATAAKDGNVQLWETGDDLKPRGKPFLHGRPVTAVAFSPDGTKLATVAGQSAYVWDIQRGWSSPAFLGHEGDIDAIAFSPDGKTLATGGKDNTARLWDVATAAEIRKFEHPKNVTTVLLPPVTAQIIEHRSLALACDGPDRPTTAGYRGCRG